MQIFFYIHSIMNCITFCTVGIMLLVANLVVCLTADKSKQKDEFYATLDADLIKRYEGIIEERKSIYVRGLLYGLLLSAVLIGYAKMETKTRFNKGMYICVAGGTTLLTNYLYYMISPKSDYMVLHLNSPKQREEWAKINRSMQLKYHVGLVLGILAAGMFGGAVCAL